MLSQSIWWSGVALEVLVLIRGFRGKLVSRYPVFYTFIAFVLFQGLLRFLAYYWRPQLYRDVYWTTEFLAVMVGCAVVFEIYRIGLSSYPGTARMARNALAFVFALALTKALVDVASDPRWWLEATARDVEGAVRAVQALSVIALVALFLFYAIPFGRNLRGILLGYGFFIFLSLLSLTFASSVVNKTAHDVWSYAHSGSWVMALSLWVAHLWSYRVNPVPSTRVDLDLEYQRLAASTHRRLQEARGYLAKAVRS